MGRLEGFIMRAATRIRQALSTLGVLTLAVMAMSVGLPTAPAEAAPAPLPWLRTAGNRIVVADTGQDVILRGANVLRSEWDMRMDAERRAIPALAQQWKGNVILRGFASDPVNAGDAGYLAMLDEHVSLALANRMYVVFAWRSHNINGEQPTMPDDRAQRALGILAKRYNGVSHVMYALQVEPHDVSWSTLRPRFESMVDAIHMSAAPHKPIVMASGTGWSRDLSGAITDPVRRANIVYKTHPYNGADLFHRQFLGAYTAGLPVFIGEFGYLPEHGMHMADVQKLMDIAAWVGLGWTAWAFDFQGGPALVADNTSFNPTWPYGQAVKTEMVKTPPAPSVTTTTTTAPPPTTTTTAPAPTTKTVTIVNNSVVGTGLGAFSFSSGWQVATGSIAKHAGDDHYSGTAGNSVSMRFSGTGITLLGSKAPWHGQAAISIDGGPEKVVEYYAPTRQDKVPLFTSPVLSAGEHVVRMRVLSTRNGYSSGNVVTLDRVDITS